MTTPILHRPIVPRPVLRSALSRNMAAATRPIIIRFLARDGTACPIQLPLSSLTAVTVALVRQDEGSCGNENVVDSGSAVVAGSVTIARATEESSTAGIRLVGLTPNTSYRILLKCVRQLGTVRTDANGNAGRTVDFPKSAVKDVYAFEISPEGGQPGPKLQSLSFKK